MTWLAGVVTLIVAPDDDWFKWGLVEEDVRIVALALPVCCALDLLALAQCFSFDYCCFLGVCSDEVLVEPWSW